MTGKIPHEQQGFTTEESQFVRKIFIRCVVFTFAVGLCSVVVHFLAFEVILSIWQQLPISFFMWSIIGIPTWCVLQLFAIANHPNPKVWESKFSSQNQFEIVTVALTWVNSAIVVGALLFSVVLFVDRW